MRCPLAAVLVFLALSGGANAQVFEYQGWVGYEVEDDPDFGCRMSKGAGGDLHLVAYGNGQEGFGIGVVKGSWDLSASRPIYGSLTFDRVHTHMLEGRVENSKLVMFESHGEEGGLAAPFAGSGSIEISLEGIRLKAELDGSSRALTMLYQCADQYAKRSYSLSDVSAGLSTEEIYISSKGPSASIVELNGVGTDNATLQARVSDVGAREYCERDPGGMTTAYGGSLTLEQCVQQTINADFAANLFASADCSRGLLKDASGRTLQYVGKDEFGTARWFDLDAREEIGSCGACNDAASTSQFEAMCPLFDR
ncbi:hypothetical protein [Devosia submarina]|uniref:hypothetical protein n=1 Tax=Devosia submarina TaxID=1173082 RepID=UPI000D3D99FF|nr:hypothetical protein [Devosia submarina]